MKYVMMDGADLTGAVMGIPKGHDIVIIDKRWPIYISPDGECSIGCETHSHEFWLNATASDVKNMHMHAAEWWSKNGAMVKAAILSVKKSEV